METSREDLGIAIRSAFLRKGAQQRFSLFALLVLSVILLFIETIEAKPFNYLRSFVKDTIYRGSILVASPSQGFKIVVSATKDHINLFNKYNKSFFVFTPFDSYK